MRALFETPEWWPRDAGDTTTDTIFKVQSVDMSDCADASKRDLVFRAFKIAASAPDGLVYAFRNYADAVALTPAGDVTDLAAANKVLARANITSVGSTVTGVAMSNNANYGPDMTDLLLQYTGTMGSEDWDRYYHYTSNLAEATLRGITAILEEYVGEGCALEEFDVHGIEYARGGRKSRNNQILVRYGTIEPAVGSQGRFSQTVGFIVRVYMVKQAEGVENDAMMAAQQIASILGDERRRINGFCRDVGITIQDTTEPEESDYPGEGIAGVQCEITGFARYKDVQFMDITT